MKQYLVASTIALMLATTVGAQNPPPGGQNPPRTPGIQNPAQTPPPTPPRPTVSSAQDSPQIATVEGCLMREEDVPGRKPNVAERAGITQDYILTSARVVKGSAPGTSASAAKPGETPRGTSGAQAMFQVTGIDDEKLQDNVGRRVQIEGTFDDIHRAQGEAKTPGGDLVELKGTVIRQVSGDCAKP
ncbi:MAG TPA: hypothetical protein VH702_21715 [Vicinamibacterales bacterium]|jgi:hypothetical protein